MSFRVFQIPARGDADAEAEMNGFLNSHRILSVERRLVEQGESSYWTFCVDYLEKGVRTVERPAKPGRDRSRIDYREKLSPENFAMYVKLRDLRKEIANAEGVPLYSVFNNEHLARMVTERMHSAADIAKIEGVGDSRIEKYAAKFLDVLNTQTSGDGAREKGESAV